MSRIAAWLRAVVAAITLLAPEAARAVEPSVPAGANDAHATPGVLLGRAISFYETGRNEECARTLNTLLARPDVDASLGRRDVERARVYYAACLVAVGKNSAADDQFRAAIRDNPQMATPSSIVFPGAVVERFIQVRDTLVEELRRSQEERARIAQAEAARAAQRAREERDRIVRLERLASEETMVEQNRRWLATVPFGVGQFQNGDTALGALFLTSETLLAATALTAVSVQLSLYSAAEGGTRLDAGQAREINENLRTAQTVFLVSTGAFLATAVAGVVEAHLSFVPERPAGVRKRSPEQPPASREEPRGGVVSFGAGPIPGGAQLGLQGVF
jgi:hypothetical protein